RDPARSESAPGPSDHTRLTGREIRLPSLARQAYNPFTFPEGPRSSLARDSQPEGVMRPILWAAALLCLLAAGPLRADEATALLDRAVEAQGGDERLAKARGLTCRTRGSLQLSNAALDLDGEAAAQGTGLVRWKVSFATMGRTNSAILVVTPDKIWN